jgi:site-specific recombinase XerC
MSPPLQQLVEEFCHYQRKPRGKTEGGVRAYRWTLEQFLKFVRAEAGRPPAVEDLTPAMIRAWMAQMAVKDLALGTMRVRQSVVSSFCIWLVRRGLLSAIYENGSPVKALLSILCSPRIVDEDCS